MVVECKIVGVGNFCLNAGMRKHVRKSTSDRTFLGVLENRSQFSTEGRHGLGIQLTEDVTENGPRCLFHLRGYKAPEDSSFCQQDDVAEEVTEARAWGPL
jgi:hypothetical protein